MFEWLASFVKSGANGRGGAPAGGSSGLVRLFTFPLKMAARLVASPFLLVRVYLRATDPWRRRIAIIGIPVATVIAWQTHSFFGSMLGGLVVGSHFGLIAGTAVTYTTWKSPFFGWLLSLFVFDGVCWLFLRFSSKEIVDDLRSMSE